MLKNTLRLLALGLLLAFAALSSDQAQVFNDVAPRNLLATSAFDAAVSPPDAEDQDFLERNSGIPNIYILLDTSASMQRLPPNGPSYYPGTLPPLKDFGCSGNGDTVDPSCTNAGLNDHAADCSDMSNCPVMGCGLDDVSRADAYSGPGTVIHFLANRVYSPPCGSSLTTGTNDPTGVPYQGSTTDYANQASVCRHWKSTNSGSGDDGFDPEFYCGSAGDNTSCSGQKPNFFDKDMVFHDTIADAPPTGAPGNGWTSTSVAPYTIGNAAASVDAFCTNVYGTTARQGTAFKKDICTQCLNTRGFLLDGRLFRQNQEGSTQSPPMPYPSIWLTGNFLNFYPPKFMVARKVMKDIIQDKADIRMALAQFSGDGAGKLAQVSDLNPSCGMSESSNFSSNRGTYINAVNDVTFGGGTPLARALLDIGQYYHTPSNPWFGQDLKNSAWQSAANANGLSICYACQVSSIIVITDGLPKSGDGNVLPAGTVTAAQVDGKMAGDPATGIIPDAASGAIGIPTSLCKKCNDFPTGQDWKNNPARVAWYLHNMDLRSEGTSGTEDCQGMGGKQTLNIYTVGFGTKYLASANRLLQNTAEMGGGSFEGAEDPSRLKQAVISIMNQISERSTSFSVATVSTLQTTTGHSVIVPRFDPDKESWRWRGHLSRYELYSEFLNKCVETTDGSGEGDLDCDGKCQSVFLQDKDGAFISEDADGIFRKNEPNLPYCIQAPLCGMTKCGIPGTAEATAWWDAATKLAERAWHERRVYSVVDGTGASGSANGRIDKDDPVFRLEATDDIADRIKPYLGDLSVCDKIGNRVAIGGNTPVGLAIQSTSTDGGRFCVKEIIRFVLGADLFNETGSTAWTTLAATDAGQNALPDRPFKLGDIFHSSPVVIDPPPPANGILCPNGLHNQCISSLWATPVPYADPAVNPYQQYANTPAYRDRRKVVLVGANDGLLHAFDGGKWHAGTDDEVTEGIDESKPPFNGYYDRGTGDELWGFLSPDMIGKLMAYMQADKHNLFVDGSPMVREVWVDGTSNQAGTGSLDGKKQPGEYHTVAVVGERRGGMRYFALDVGDATQLPEGEGTPVAPKFLWISPQPNDRRSTAQGSTYTDFLPVGPPIGPVRIEADETSGTAFRDVTPRMSVPGVSGGVPYHEKWVAFLSGGFDPHYQRGRGVYMVDVWTGKELFDFSYPESSASATGDVRLNLKYPIPATVGMVQWGANERRQQSFENDGYFDTATFGDTGGQLWVIRMSRPGKLDSVTKKVTNWYGARIMSMEGCANQPFFYITANVAVRQGFYRVLAGTGDRYNLLDKNGGDCGPDNPRACWQRGCSVSLLSSDNQVKADGAGGLSTSLSLSGSACSTATATSASLTATADQASGQTKMTISCPGNTATSRIVTRTCTLDATNGWVCAAGGSDTEGVRLTPSGTISDGNWYVSLRVWDEEGARKIFSTSAEASAYDTARWTISSKTSASTGLRLLDGTDSPLASTVYSAYNEPGWAIYYNHDSSVTVSDHKYTVSWLDERTSSTSAVYAGVFWNTTQQAQGEVTNESKTCTKKAKCVAEGRRVTYHYGASVETGERVLKDLSGNFIRSSKNVTLVPAMGDQPTVFINQKGQIQIGLTAVNPERGATNTFAGQGNDPSSDYGYVDVSRAQHACRHAANQAEAETNCK